MQNVYQSSHLDAARVMEQRLAEQRWAAAQNPMQTGIVPQPAFADMFQAPSEAPMNPLQPVESLTGEAIPAEHFTHNNMQPFFGGRVRQNQDPEAHFSRLEAYTGTGGVWEKKKEVVQNEMFAPTPGVTNICGMRSHSDTLQERIVQPVARRNDFPIEQVQVGPGINQGYTAQPSGGFHNIDLQQYIVPKTVDELRVVGKERVVTEGRSGPAQGTAQRGIIAPIEKNRPDTTFCQGPEKYGVATGTVAGETGRPTVDLKTTVRPETTQEYIGASAPTRPNGDPKFTNYILNDTQQLPELPEGNLALSHLGSDSEDYGKANIQVYSNERSITSTKTVTANLTSSVKAAIAPLMDLFRHTKAEYTLDSARPMGELQAGATIPSKPTTYDPVDHQMRTTIKETTIHDGAIGNLKGPENGRASNPEDMKPTVRNTLPIKEEMRNFRSGTYKVAVYDPKQLLKTTNKETIECNKHNGNVDTVHPMGAYVYIEVEAPNTQKQFLSDKDYIGTPAKGKHDGYRIVQYTFVPHATQKQFVSDKDYIGIAGNKDKKTISTFMWNTIKDKTGKEALEVGRAPTASGPKNASGREVLTLESSKTNPASAREFGAGIPVLPSQGSIKDSLGMSTKVNGLLTTQKDDRLDTSVLAALKDNPFVQSIVPIMA